MNDFILSKAIETGIILLIDQVVPLMFVKQTKVFNFGSISNFFLSILQFELLLCSTMGTAVKSMAFFQKI